MLKSREISVCNVAKFIHHYGWLEFSNRIRRRIIKPVYEDRTLYIFKLTCQTAAKPDQNIKIVELTKDDIDRMQEVMYVSRAGLQGRFSRGDRCFSVIEKGDILSFFWSRSVERCLPELHLKFSLKPYQMWMYNAVTVKRARGRGLYPNVICHMAAVLGQEGIDELFVDVEQSNRASLRGIERVGCKRIVRIRMRKFASIRKYHLQIHDKVDWQQLAKTIDDFSNIKWCFEEKS